MATIEVVHRNTPLVNPLPEDFSITQETYAAITENNKIVAEVYRTLSGEPTFIFEYNDGSKYAVKLLDLYAEVDTVHKEKIRKAKFIAEQSRRRTGRSFALRRCEQFINREKKVSQSKSTRKRVKLKTKRGEK